MSILAFNPQSSFQFVEAVDTTNLAPACGMVVSNNMNLSADLTCMGDGLIVGSDNIVIHLNGFSISGPGPTSEKVGIAVPHANYISIQGPGRIENFQAGILVTGGSSSSSSSSISEISKNDFVDKLGYIHVVGEIQNVGTSPVEFIKANVAFYDLQNNIIGVDSVYTNPHVLQPGQSATYSVLAPPDSVASSDFQSVRVKYEYQINGGTYSSGGQELPPTAGASAINITSMMFKGNKIGVFLTNTEDTFIGRNNFGPNTIGIASHSSQRLLMDTNNLTTNDLAGITIVNTDSSQIKGNYVSGSRNGIFLDAQSSKNIVSANTAIKNDVDINHADGLPLNINQNEVFQNKCFVSQPTGGCNLP